DEEVPPPEPVELAGFIADAQATVDELLEGSARGRVLAQGARVAILGRPNVGKSSLLNALLGDERAIVTPIAGTTRDTVEERAILGGVAVHLVDTAGLTETDDPIERIGVERSRSAARSAELLLLVVDSSVGVTVADRGIAQELNALRADDVTGDAETGASTPVIVVANKADLPSALRAGEVEDLWPRAPVISVSCVTHEGLEALAEAVGRLALGGEMHPA